MADVIKSWDHDENLLILRRTLLSPILSMQVSWHYPSRSTAY